MTRQALPILHGTRNGYARGCKTIEGCPESPSCVEVAREYHREWESENRARRKAARNAERGIFASEPPLFAADVQTDDEEIEPDLWVEHIPLEWQSDALCTQVDPEFFFPDKGGTTKPAKSVCAACTVREQCLAYALEHDQRWGIWGGLSEWDRRKLVRVAS